jgi:hypothetical protein
MSNLSIGIANTIIIIVVLLSLVLTERMPVGRVRA